MSSFTEATLEPTGETREGRAVFRVARAFSYDIGFVGSGLTVTVPAGFETDGPSVPAWALRIVDVDSFVRSACVHDLLRQDLRFTKVDGDAILLTAMQAEGVKAWQRELLFLAVRLNRSRARAV